jgi:hypothetical protein
VGSPVAEVHRQDYAEHENLLAHSPGTHTTAGSSIGDGASGATMGSPAAQGGSGIRGLPPLPVRRENDQRGGM